MTVLSLFEIVMLSGVGGMFLYLAFLSLLALIHRGQKPQPLTIVRRFAVCVPAHDEEETIEKTLRNLRCLDYPRESYDMVVVADNCEDHTADIAKDQGAIVLERTDPARRGKGYALRWCFDQLLTRQPGYDGIVVVDADSILSENFLSVMNSYLENGAEAVQSSDMAETNPGNWSPEVTRLGFALYNYVRPFGRRLLGLSCGLRGNGMCFSSGLLRRVLWEAYSLNEDLEYGLQLLLKGETVVFAPEAKVVAAMPSMSKNAESQRARWEAGRYAVIWNYSGALLKAFFTSGSFKFLDALVDLVTPPLINLVAIAVVLLCGSLFLWAVGLPSMGLYSAVWILVLMLAGVHVLVGLSVAGADASLFKALVHAPRYAVWKISLYLRLFRPRRSKEWIRTTRELPSAE